MGDDELVNSFLLEKDELEPEDQIDLYEQLMKKFQMWISML